MIPALLSCLFVFYLYRTLNETNGDGGSDEISKSTSTGQSEMKALERELALLRRRLQTLVAAQTGGETE